jgi:DNA-binding NarL/FixJ family response regulator
MSIRVVVAEDHALLRQGLERMLKAAPDVELVGSAVDLPSLLELIEREDPDVVVTDIRMPPTGTDEGIRVAAQLRKERPRCGVVVLSQHAEAAYALALLADGSAGRAYLLKERVADLDELLAAVREVANGGSRIDSQVVEQLVMGKRDDAGSELSRLTPRETEVLGEMAQGKSNGAIAASLVLSERAVEKHTNSIFSKLGLSEERDLNRRVKAVLVYLNGHQGA